jgi:hypothetical protein
MKLWFKFFILIFFITSLYSDVLIKSGDTFISNENFIFEIEANGSNVDFPKIDKIDNYIVSTLGTSRTMTSINGNVVNKIKKTFSIRPTKDFILPSFEVKVDGKVFKTKEKLIKKVIPTKSKSPNFDFQISLNKSSLYVGEEAILNLKFKYKKSLQIADLAFSMPVFNDIWSKKIANQDKSYEENGFVIQELNFLISPQKSGELRIAPIKIEAKVIDDNASAYSFFSQATKDERIYSNALNLDVKPLPNNVNLIGDFNIKTSISKNEINEGESISYKVEVDGTGNIDDMDDVKLNILDATVFEDKPKIETKIINNKNVGTYKKSFSIIANKDFVIPEIELKYFDKNTQKVVVKKTKSYKIKVNKVEKKESFKGLEKAEPKKEIEVVKQKTVYKTSFRNMAFSFVAGVVFTTIIFLLYSYIKNKSSKQKDDLPLVKLVKNSKNENEIMKILLPYIGYNKNLDELIFKLEKDKNLDLKVIKKEIVKILESLKL